MCAATSSMVGISVASRRIWAKHRRRRVTQSSDSGCSFIFRVLSRGNLPGCQNNENLLSKLHWRGKKRFFYASGASFESPPSCLPGGVPASCLPAGRLAYLLPRWSPQLPHPCWPSLLPPVRRLLHHAWPAPVSAFRWNSDAP